MSRVSLRYWKETPNKYVYIKDCDGIRFNLYIPKWRVPEQVPGTIAVKFHSNFNMQNRKDNLKEAYEKDTSLRNQAIISRIVKTEDLLDKVKFEPYGIDIGSPYVPKHILPEPNIKELYIEIEWRYL